MKERHGMLRGEQSPMHQLSIVCTGEKGKEAG